MEIEANVEANSFAQYIKHTKELLTWFRMWKSEDGLERWKEILIACNTTWLLSCILFSTSCEMRMIRSSEDLRDIAAIIGVLWFHLLGSLKWTYCIWKASEVNRLAGELEECYNLSLGISDSTEDASKLHEIMLDAKESSLIFTRRWTVFMIYGVLHWFANPIILKFRPDATMDANNASDHKFSMTLPYAATFPWDTKEPFGYWMGFLVELFAGLGSGVGQVAYDSFYVTMTTMICGQVQYLNWILDDHCDGHSNTIISSDRRKRLNPRFLKNRLARGKTYHLAILKCFESLEKATNRVMFVQCIGTLGILCLVSFDAMTMKLKGDMKNTIRIWSSVEYLFGEFIECFVFCYYANRVTTLGLQVSNSAYSCGWDSLQSETAESSGFRDKDIKAVEFLTYEIINRAQKPLELTGGPFYTLSLETYSTVVKTAFSYSAVLREVG